MVALLALVVQLFPDRRRSGWIPKEQKEIMRWTLELPLLVNFTRTLLIPLKQLNLTRRKMENLAFGIERLISNFFFEVLDLYSKVSLVQRKLSELLDI